MGDKSAARRPTIGLMLPAVANADTGRVDAPRYLEVARIAEAGGFDGVYVGDHLLHPDAQLESVVALSAAAAVTQRVSIGFCVMLIALRDPIWLARQLGTLASFAPGRLRIGLGVGGEYPAEFAAAGVPLAERGKRLEEVAEKVKRLLAGELPLPRNADDLPVNLEPLPSTPIPYFLAGYKEVALRRAAALGDGWIGYLLSAESFARRRSLLLEHRATLGGGPFFTGMLLPVHPDPIADGAQARAAVRWAKITKNNVSFPDRLFVAGPPASIVDQLRRYWDAGCSEFVFSIAEQGHEHIDHVRILTDKILPKVREFGNAG